MNKRFVLHGVCAACAAGIEQEVRALRGVREATFGALSGTLQVESAGEWPEGLITDIGDIIRRIEPGATLTEVEPPASRTIYLKGLSCADCAERIEREVAQLPGVRSASVRPMAQELTVEADSAENLPAILRQAADIAAKIDLALLLPGRARQAIWQRVNRVFGI